MSDKTRSRLRSGAWVLGGSVLVLVLGFVGANLYPVQAPAPLWTEADLATDVPESDNGWSLATAPHRFEIPEQLQPLVVETDHDADRFWAQVDDDAVALHEFMGTSDAREAIERVDAVRSRPAFVESCPPGAKCLAFGWFTIHRIAVLRAIDLAVAGDSVNSTVLLRDLIRIDVAHLHSARTLVSFIVALANLNKALDKADMLAVRLGQTEVAPDVNAALADLALVVRGLDVEAINLERVVIGEYLWVVEMLDLLEAGDPEAFGNVELPREMPLLYSRSRTLRDVNTRYEGRYQRVVDHDTSAVVGGGERSPKQQFGWWFRNPVGKIVIDALIVDLESTVESLDEDLVELGQTRERLLARPAVLAATK